ncbi:hypothetical protein A0J61_00183 [Choanephora cucurbitarum]|uniref:Uncharacterized protein n=1 Tax=Choanephora cucurbitarum TaxID=101091 RepID=A0A1C7NRT8_9FUNG|nr:hypothetical protein A0J61_00183 [Choanephora cucurbitarum]
MEFEEVHDYINQDKAQQNHSTSSLDHLSSLDQVNPYNALFQPSQRNTLSGFVHRLRQQSSKTRFVREYKKMASLFDTTHPEIYSEKPKSDIEDDASLRIRDRMKPHDDTVNQLVIKKRPLKKVVINESANQICDHAISLSPYTPDASITLPEALDGLRQTIQILYDKIEYETNRIHMYQEEMARYRDQCGWMDSQLDAIHSSFDLFYRDTMPEMKAQRERMIQNELKVRIHQKKHKTQKQRFERYRKAMSIDTRLTELKKKIQVAWKQDEVWLGIRDWGLLSVILIVLMVTTFVWQF